MTTGTVREIGAMAGPQWDFLQSQARHPGFSGGAGSGKTVGSVLKMFSYVQENPGADGCLTVPVMDDMTRFYLPTIRKFFGDAEGTGWVWLEKKAMLVFPELRSTVFVRSGMEPVVGMTLAFFGMDEPGIGDQEQTFYSLQLRLRQEGYPHQGWLTFTPNIQRPWLRTIYQDRVFPMTENPLEFPEEYPIFFARTKDNIHLPDWQRNQMISEWGDTRLAKQMLEGQFIAVEGVAFDLSERHFREPPRDHRFVRYHVGFDPGAVSPTALIVIGEDESKKLWALSEFYKRNATEYDWMNWLRDQGFDTVIGDPTGISERQRTEWMKTYGVRVKPARFKEFDRRYRAWLSRLAIKPEDGNPGMYISPSCVNLRRELENLAFAKPKGYADPVDHWVPGSLDHAYDAGAYAIMEFDSMYWGNPPRMQVSYEGLTV